VANVGRISGPLLKSNLLRDGVDLAFETDLLYLDVNNNRIGIKNASPSYDLDITGTTRTTELKASIANIDDVQIDTRTGYGDDRNQLIQKPTIRSTSGDLWIEAETPNDIVHIHERVHIPQLFGDVATFPVFNMGDLQITDNILQPINTNQDLIIRANGTGEVNIYGLTVDSSGNVDISGDSLALGNLFLNGDGDATGINSRDSNTDLLLNSSGTGTVRANGIDLLAVEGNAYHVTANGDDTHSGESIEDAFATVKHALTVAEFGDTIYIGAGVFEEEAPLVVPQGVNLVGNGLRTTQLKPTPATRSKDFIQLNGEVTVENLTIREIEWDSVNETGYAFCYAPASTVTKRSAYLRHVTILNFGSSVRQGTNAADDPYGFDAGDAGRGIFVDGASIAPGSIEAAMLFDSVTAIVPNSVGLVLTNGARGEWLNSFVYFADEGIIGVEGPLGKFGQGKTKLELAGISGTIAAGDTGTFTSTDGSTVVNVTVESVQGDTILLDGRVDDFELFDFTPASIAFTPSGATATSIVRYDRKDFGAELRSIASANVYGNKGIIANGADVRLRMSSHDFGYIGSGKKFDNNDNDVVQINEVTEANEGKVFINSTDQYGDYRIGDLFFVNQDTGAVTFSGGQFDVTNLSGITFTDGSNSTTVQPSFIETGNLRFTGNTISSTFEEINIAPDDSILNIAADTNITGSLDVTGNISLGGNIFIGDQDTDNVTVIADFTSNIIPNEPDTYDLGASNKRWNRLFARLLQVQDVIISDNLNVTGEIFGGAVNTDDIRVAGNRISTTQSNANLEIDVNGTGTIELQANTNVTGDFDVSSQATLASANIEDLTDDRIVIAGPNGELEDDANLTFDGLSFDVGTGNFNVNVATGNTQILGTLDVTGQTELASVNVEDLTNNRIVIVGTDGELEDDSNLTFDGTTFKVGTDTTDKFTVDVATGNTFARGTFEVDGQSTLASAAVEDLTENRLVVVGTNGELEDDENLTWDGTILTVTGNAKVTGTFEVDSQSTLASVAVEDLTNDRIVIVGTDGELEDDGNFTFDGTTFNIGQGNFTVDRTNGNTFVAGTFETNGQATLASANIEDLTSGRVVLAGTNGELEDNANLTFNGTLLTVTGNLDVTGDVTIGGNITIGDQDTDGITVAADFESNIIPNASNTFDLGSSVKGWRTLHVGQIEVDSIEINDNYIRTQDSNADLVLTPNGIGTVIIDSNQALQIPVGDNAVRPNGTTGQVRFNTDSGLFEGYNGTAWSSLGGVRDVDQDTFIDAELSPGSDEDTLFFSTGGITSATLTARLLQLNTDLNVQGTINGVAINTDDIRIAGNRLETTDSNANLEVAVNGTGTIELLASTNITGDFDTSGQATLASANIEDLTSGRVVLAGTDGELEDSANLTFDGTDLIVTGNITATNNLDVDVQATLASANVEDLTDNRIVIAGTDGELEDDANFTFDGTTFNVGQDNFTVDVATGNTQVNGTLDVNGQSTFASVNVQDLAPTRIVHVGTSGELIDSANLTFDNNLLTVTGDAKITGSLDIDGNITLGGNIRIGDQDVDTVEVQADFTSDLVPDGPNRFDLGTISKGWRTLYAGQVEVDSIEINDNYIRTQESNTDLELRPNGTGTVIIDSDQALQIPVGDTSVRPVGITGQIRFNVSDNLFEGYNGTAWSSLGGVRDVDGDTYILPELSSGGDQDTLYFYTNDNQTATLNSTRFDVVQITVDDLRIDNNRIETTTANTNVEIQANGSGILELLSNTNITGTLDVSNQTTLASAAVEDLAQDRIVIVGANGELEDSVNFTFDGSSFDIGQGKFTVDVATGNITTDGNTTLNGQVTVDSLAVKDLTNDRLVKVGSNGELEDTAELTYDGDLLTVDGDALVTGNLDVNGNITLGGNIRIGDQDVDTVEVQADFTSDLIPDGPNRFDLGSSSKGWRTLHVGQIEVDSLEINDNYIRTQTSNANIELRPNGTGTVVIDSDQALQIPVGDNAVRPSGIVGQIRFNNETTQFEGYQGNAWASLGGIRDVDGDTYIIPESNAGADEDTLYFYTGANLSATLDANRLDLKGSDILFGNNYATVADLPSAFNNVGMFAYVTATDKAYYSKAGQWIQLVGQKGDFEIEGTLNAAGIKIGNDTVNATDENANLNLVTNGNGKVFINGDRAAVFGDNISEFNNDSNYITRNDLGASGDITYNPLNGIFSVTTYKTADFEADFANQDTDDLSEGTTNLYFLNSRARSAISVSDNGGDGSLAYDSATGVITYTGPSAAEVRAHFSAGGDLDYNSATGVFSVTTFKTADARQSISVSDAGGDGSLTYNNTTGVITYVGPSAAEVRAHFSAGGDLSYDSGTGEFSVTTYKDADARGAISVTDAGGDGSLSYNSTTGVITYTGPSATEVRAHFSAGGDLAYNQTTGQFSVTTYKDADARAAISVTDAGGDGSMTYNNTTGVITYTGPSAAETRAHFSAAGDLSYNSSNGVFSVTTYKSADFDSDFAGKSTDDLSEGSTNQYFTTARARQSVSADGDLAYNSTTGVFSVTTYKTADFNTDFAASSFDNLDDTDFSSKSVNQLIRWNGTDWTNFTIGIDFLSDVDITSVAPNINETLVWNGVNFVPSSTISISEIQGNTTFTDNVIVNGDIIGGALVTDDIRIAGNRIETTASNSILELGTQGTGVINLLDNTLFDGTVTISDTLTANGNTVLGDTDSDTVTFNADVASNIIPSTGTLDLGSAGDAWQNLYAGNLQLGGNSLTALDANGNVELTPDGTGYVDINTNTGLLIPTGTDAERPTAVQGMIRFNTTDGRFEAYDGNAWTGLGGVIDVDQDTYIKAENNPGDDNDQLDFFAGGTHILTVDENGINFESPTTNTISTTSGSLILDPAPAGSEGTVIIQGDLSVQGTTTTFNSTITTLDDPLITLGGDTAPIANDGKDRGVEFRYHDGSNAKLGFFGYDANTAKFKFIPDAVNASEVISGAVGNVEFADATLNDVTANSLTLTTDLVVEHGGTGASTFTAKGILYGNGTDPIQVTDAAGTNDATTSNEILTVDAQGTPVWTDVIDEGEF